MESNAERTVCSCVQIVTDEEEKEILKMVVIEVTLYFNSGSFLSVLFRTILLSIISLLNEPNTSSPANVDASVSFRKWKESKGRDKEYEAIVRFGFCHSYFLFFGHCAPDQSNIKAKQCSSICE